MMKRRLAEGIHWVGAVDWSRRVFDALMPLPQGTTYNAYLLEGSEKTALLDTVEPQLGDHLLAHLESVDRLDLVVCHHVEQDHSGMIPVIMDRFPQARLLCSSKAKSMLADHLDVDLERVQVVTDGECVDLGGMTIQFISTPWVHWPETMCTYVPERKALFSCDFFGAHVATSDLVCRDFCSVRDAAKHYYAEIMMPFRKAIAKNLKRLEALDFEWIAPSHGPIHVHANPVLEAYSDWVDDRPENRVLLPWVSMHGSTAAMVETLIGLLDQRGLSVHAMDLAETDFSAQAMHLVDAASAVFASPTVNGGLHPHIMSGLFLIQMLKPKLRCAALIGSYGWGGKAANQFQDGLEPLRLEILDPVLCKGFPGAAQIQELEGLADALAQRHVEWGLLDA